MPRKKKKSVRSRKPTKAEQIAKIPIEQLVSARGEEGRKQLIKYARTLRTGYVRRVQAFERHGIFSYAQKSLERSIQERKTPFQLTKMTRNQLILEIARYQKFFNDQTSSIEGIKAVNREQDIRIFGVNPKTGKPRSTMSDEQRIKFWDLYDEYRNQYVSAIYKYPSEEIQQILADAMFDDKDWRMDPEDPDFDISFLLHEVDERLRENKFKLDMESVPNVYSGKGPNIE